MHIILLLASALVITLSGCGSEPSLKSPTGTDSGEVDRWETRHRPAAISIKLSEPVVHPGDRIGFQLINRGDVPMMTHLPFTVERWDVRAWITVPEPDNSAWPSIGIDMPPGARTKTQHWPFDAMDDPVPGRYRVVKTAVYEEPEHGSSRELTATATFKVMK